MGQGLGHRLWGGVVEGRLGGVTSCHLMERHTRGGKAYIAAEVFWVGALVGFWGQVRE